MQPHVPATPPTDRLTYTEGEVEALLGFRPRTLAARRLRRQPVPPFVKLGDKTLYPIKALHQWLDTQLQESGGVTAGLS